MTDIDFDELDKAVTSLMGDTSDETTPKEQTAATPAGSTPVASSTQPTTEEAAAPAAIEVTSPKPASAPTATGSLAAKRTGRFMDVVHPSSDMKAAQKPSSSRQGPTITPTTPTTVAPIAEPSPAVVNPSPVAAPTEWPDPIDVHNQLQSNADTSADNAAPVSDEQPLNSPFLPDAKVEKRPLGSPPLQETTVVPLIDTTAPDGATTQTASEPVAATTSDVATEPTQLAAIATDESAPLPAELNSDLVAIESAETEPMSVEPAAAPTAVAPAPAEAEPSSVSSATIDEIEATVAEPSPVIETGSITQQYKETPSTGDAEHASIYDTDAHHQPLAHPAKKRSGWLWVFLVILFLAIGAGIGAALYFFKIV